MTREVRVENPDGAASPTGFSLSGYSSNGRSKLRIGTDQGENSVIEGVDEEGLSLSEGLLAGPAQASWLGISAGAYQPGSLSEKELKGWIAELPDDGVLCLREKLPNFIHPLSVASAARWVLQKEPSSFRSVSYVPIGEESFCFFSKQPGQPIPATKPGGEGRARKRLIDILLANQRPLRSVYSIEDSEMLLCQPEELVASAVDLLMTRFFGFFPEEAVPYQRDRDWRGRILDPNYGRAFFRHLINERDLLICAFSYLILVEGRREKTDVQWFVQEVLNFWETLIRRVPSVFVFYLLTSAYLLAEGSSSPYRGHLNQMYRVISDLWDLEFLEESYTFRKKFKDLSKSASSQ